MPRQYILSEFTITLMILLYSDLLYIIDYTVNLTGQEKSLAH